MPMPPASTSQTKSDLDPGWLAHVRIEDAHVTYDDMNRPQPNENHRGIGNVWKTVVDVCMLAKTTTTDGRNLGIAPATMRYVSDLQRNSNTATLLTTVPNSADARLDV